MKELEITWDHVSRIWWLMTWRIAAAGVVYAAIIVFSKRYFPSAVGYFEIIGFLLALAWNLKFTGMALRKRYEDFRIVLVPLEAGGSEAPKA